MLGARGGAVGRRVPSSSSSQPRACAPSAPRLVPASRRPCGSGGCSQARLPAWGAPQLRGPPAHAPPAIPEDPKAGPGAPGQWEPPRQRLWQIPEAPRCWWSPRDSKCPGVRVCPPPLPPSPGVSEGAGAGPGSRRARATEPGGCLALRGALTWGSPRASLGGGMHSPGKEQRVRGQVMELKHRVGRGLLAPTCLASDLGLSPPPDASRRATGGAAEGVRTRGTVLAVPPARCVSLEKLGTP